MLFPLVINQILYGFDQPSWLFGALTGPARASYWVGGSGNFSDAANHWSDRTGGAPGAQFLPDALTDAVFDQNSAAAAYTVTIDVSSVCKNLNFAAAPPSGTITWAGSAALALFGGYTLLPGMTRTYTGAITLSSTGVGNMLTSNGVALASNLTFSGSGGFWAPVDALNTTGNLVHNAGTVNYMGVAINAASFQMQQAAATVILGAATVVLTSSWFITNGSLSAAQSTITCGLGANFTGGTNAYGNVTLTANSAAGTIAGANSFVNLTLLNNAAKTPVWAFSADQVISGTLKYLGNSATNRILLASSVVGTPRTITAAAIDAASDFVDFQDITGAGAAAPFATGTSIGDCGGNSGITPTVAATQTATGTASLTWSTHAWSGSPSRVPLPQDDVVINNAFVAGRTITVDMPRMGKSVTCTCTGSPTITNSGTTVTMFGSPTWATGMTVNFSAGNGIVFAGRGSFGITSNSVALGATNFVVNAPGGTFTYNDPLTVVAAATNLVNGTINTNGFAYSISGGGGFRMDGGTFNAGASLIMVTDPTVSAVSVGGTFNKGASTIKVVSNSMTQKVFAGGGASFATVWLSGSVGGMDVSGANSIDVFKNDIVGVVVRWPGSVTNTVGDYQGVGVAPSGSDYAFARFFALVNGITTPDASANQIVGDLGIAAYVEAENWSQSSGVNWTILGKRTVASGASSYQLMIPTGLSGKLRAVFSLNGTTTTNVDSTVGDGFANGSGHWVAVTRNATTGDWKFWTSNDPQNTALASVSWTQLGATVAGATGNLAAGDSTLSVGNLSSSAWQGRISRAALLNSTNLAATPVADFNAATYTSGATWVSATGETWTIGAGASGGAHMMRTNAMGIGSTTNAAATLSKSGGGTIDLDYLNISRSTASPANTWYAGTHSVDEGSNTGWRFDARILSTGALVVGAATLAGAGLSSWDGTGALVVGVATLAGAGGAAWVSVGQLIAGTSIMQGAGISKSDGTGDLDAQASDVDGHGEVPMPPRRVSGLTGVVYQPPKLIGVVQ